MGESCLVMFREIESQNVETNEISFVGVGVGVGAQEYEISTLT